MRKVPYALDVGSLMYVMVYTQLDITHVVGVLSHYGKSWKGALDSNEVGTTILE